MSSVRNFTMRLAVPVNFFDFKRPVAMPIGLISSPLALREQDPDWEFFLPDEEPYPSPDDFWLDQEEDEDC